MTRLDIKDTSKGKKRKPSLCEGIVVVSFCFQSSRNTAEQLCGCMPVPVPTYVQALPSISTAVFRKKTHTDRYLHFDSNHPARVKRGIIQCLRHRAEKVCNGSMRWAEIRHLREVFKANGYPETVVKRNLRARPTPTNSSRTSQPAPKLLLPYVPGLSERIERVCRPLGVKTVCRSRVPSGVP